MSSLNGTSMMNMLRLSSQSLPTGAFSYSQGMEWLVDTKRIQDEETVYQWIAPILYGPYANYELPILRTMLEAWRDSDHQILAELNQDYLITRETSEIQKETLQMGYALKGVIHEMSIISSHSTEFLMQLEYVTFPSGFSFCSFMADLSVEGTTHFGGEYSNGKYEFNITRYFNNLLNNDAYTYQLYLLASGGAVNANRTIIDNSSIKISILYSEL